MRAWWALALALGAFARADDLVTIEPGYRLRRGHGYKFGWDTVVRRPTKARIIASKGPWRKVCIGGSIDGCVGGRAGWVFRLGIRSSASEIARTAGGCAYGRCPPRPDRAQQSIEGIANAISDGTMRYQDLPSGFSPGCYSFISRNGLGRWGELMTRTAERYAKECFYDSNIFGDLCPKYLSLSMPKKKAMVAMAFAAIGQQEARGCDPNAVNPGASNDQGDGMFMMEHSTTQRTRAARDRVLCEPSNEHAATFSPAFQANCTISIINDTICGVRGKRLIHRYKDNYFAELKGEGIITRRIRATARRWNLCQ